MSLLSLIHFTGLDFLPAAFDYTSAARFGCRLTVVAQQALLSIISALRSICAESLWRVWREIIRQLLVVAAFPAHIKPLWRVWREIIRQLLVVAASPAHIKPVRRK